MPNFVVGSQIPGGLELFVTKPGPFDESVEVILEVAKGELASPQQIAQARSMLPSQHYLWKDLWTSVNLVYVPAHYAKSEREPFVLWTSLLHSPISAYTFEKYASRSALDNARQATSYHLGCSEFYVGIRTLMRQARRDEAKPPAERAVYIDRQVDKVSSVSVAKLQENPLMQFLFKNDLDAYTTRLAGSHISSVSVRRADINRSYLKKKPFAYALILGRSILDGRQDLVWPTMACGVRFAQINLYELVREAGYKSNDIPKVLESIVKAPGSKCIL